MSLYWERNQRVEFWGVALSFGMEKGYEEKGKQLFLGLYQV